MMEHNDASPTQRELIADKLRSYPAAHREWKS